MLSTVSDVIEKSLSYILGNDREERNALAAAITDTTSTTLTFTYDLGGIRNRSEIEIDTELMYVWSVNASAKTAVVQRGFKGTTAATHTNGSIATVNPRYYRFQLLDDFNAELASYSSPSNGLYRPKNVELTYYSTVRGYEFTPTDCIDILEIRARAATGITGDWRLVRSYRLLRSVVTTGTDATYGFTNAQAITIDDALSAGYPINVVYKAPFTAISALTDALTTTFLQTEAYDIIPMGIAIRQNVAREIPREQYDAQPDSRRASEVPPGAVNASFRQLQMTYQKRIADEATRLIQRYPLRSRRTQI